MKKILLLSALVVSAGLLFAQNVFNPSDPIVRYDKNRSYGSSQNPDTNRLGLQKWVSTATSGVSTGSSAWDASSFKAYFINLNGNRMSFRVKFPKSYASNPTKIYPVMIFLHGAGEVGCATNGGIYNNEKQLQHGGKLFMDAANGTQFDGFLLYPQIVARSECWDSWNSVATSKFTAVISIVDSLSRYVRADIDRVLVNGLSGGGYGAWRMAALMPQRITKIAPSASVGSTSSRTAFVHIPIWFATGGKDPDPSPAQADYALNRMKEIGADIRYTRYPDLGHAVWYSHWREPDYFPYMNDMHKANPLVFFQQSEFCEGQAINARLGITGGFYAYEWQKDNITIATRTGTTNTIVNGASVISYAGNEINVRSFGSYRVRFKRFSYSPWSAWSMKPADIKAKNSSPANSITVSGLASKVLPALDGSTTTPLTLPAGYTNYEWVRTSDNVVVGNQQLLQAPTGTYKGRYNDQFGCPYTYSPVFTVVNANGSPKPAAATGLVATALSLSSTRLNWTQGSGETNFEIYRSTTKGGPYQLLQITNANATTYTDNGLNPDATYYYVVRAVNNTGAAAKSNEASPDNGNTAPVVSAIADLVVQSDATASRNFTVTDNAGDVVTVTIPLKPEFVTLEKLNTTDYRIVASPSASNIGWTDIEVVAKDSKGKTGKANCRILVANKNTRSVFVNLGNASKPAPAPFNNWLGTRAANSTITALKDENNSTTSFGITALNSWTTLTDLGHITGNNSGIIPDVALQSGIADNGAAKQFLVSGLNPTKRYNLMFIGSQNEGLMANASYNTGSQTTQLNARYNTNSAASLNSLIPDASGSITVTITRISGSAYTYLNTIVIEEYDASISLIPPARLYAEPADRNIVNLTWVDKTNNEAATGGYELQRSTNASFSSGLVTISLPANTSSYRNTGLSSNTRYYYRVRAKNGGTVSDYSNVFSVITPSTIVYVNFNTTVAGGPSPWNNLFASSTTSFTKSSLKNQSGSSTSFSLRLDKFFNGEFNAGCNTGNNSGVVPDNVLKSDYWLDNSQLSQMRLSGLNTGRRYRIGFFGSASSNGWYKGNYTATYSVNNRTVYLNSWENTSKVVYIGDLVPQSGGILTLNFSTVSNAGYGFNGGVIIQEYSDGQGGVMLNQTLDSGYAVQESEPLYKFKASPNPFRDQLTLEFDNPDASRIISAEVYDMNGRVMSRHQYNRLPEGKNVLLLKGVGNTSNTGLVIVALKANGRIVATKTILKSE